MPPMVWVACAGKRRDICWKRQVGGSGVVTNPFRVGRGMGLAIVLSVEGLESTPWLAAVVA